MTAFINLMLALGKVGRPFSGYGTLTGQGNGQGGREHGQKADQLPGYRLIENDADRRHMAAFWGVEASALPAKAKALSSCSTPAATTFARCSCSAATSPSARPTPTG